jgi:hypothetical protein
MDDDIPKDEILQRDEDTPVDEINWTTESDKAMNETPNLSTDDSDLEDPVLLSKGEYHEIKNDGRPACDAGGKLERVERKEAYEVAYPCQEVWCKRYRKKPHRF